MRWNYKGKMNVLRTRLSVLDRLLDKSGGTAQIRTASVGELRDSVKEHLNWVLNTRRPLNQDLDLEAYAGLHGTILDYGLPDFAGFSLDSAQTQEEVALAIQNVIRAFEPRLQDISVVPFFNEGSLTFRVRASLIFRPASERVQFQAVLEAASGRLVAGEIHIDA